MRSSVCPSPSPSAADVAVGLTKSAHTLHSTTLQLARCTPVDADMPSADLQRVLQHRRGFPVDLTVPAATSECSQRWPDSMYSSRSLHPAHRQPSPAPSGDGSSDCGSCIVVRANAAFSWLEPPDASIGKCALKTVFLRSGVWFWRVVPTRAKR